MSVWDEILVWQTHAQSQGCGIFRPGRAGQKVGGGGDEAGIPWGQGGGGGGLGEPRTGIIQALNSTPQSPNLYT